MKKLIKDYEVDGVELYYNLIIDSVINGQRTQAYEQFKYMPKEYRKGFIKWCINESLIKEGLIVSRDVSKFIDLI